MREINLALENMFPSAFSLGKWILVFVVSSLPCLVTLTSPPAPFSPCPDDELSRPPLFPSSCCCELPLLYFAATTMTPQGPCALSRAITGKALPQLSSLLAGCCMVQLWHTGCASHVSEYALHPSRGLSFAGTSALSS